MVVVYLPRETSAWSNLRMEGSLACQIALQLNLGSSRAGLEADIVKPMFEQFCEHTAHRFFDVRFGVRGACPLSEFADVWISRLLTPWY